MKKILFTIFSLLLLADFVFAGGIVTNTNQSAAWVRTLARDASVDVDAVFFNPAGLTHLEDGFYFQVNSQTITQGRTVNSTFPGLNQSEYEGKTFVPFLPTAFAVFKKGNFAVSGGFTVIGGGGSAEFDKGLPEFEYQVSGLPAGLAGLVPIGQSAGVDLSTSGYSMNSSLVGSSGYFGYQAAFTYKFNDMLSVAVGGRYVTAKNTYEGYLKDISLITPSGTIRADDFINQKAIPTINGVKGQLTQVLGIPTLLNPYLATYGGATLAQAKPLLDQIDPTYYTNLVKAAVLIGQDPNLITLQQLNDGILAGTPTFNAQIAQLTGTAASLAATATSLADKELNVEQTGSGFSPFFGLDLSLMDGNFGLAVKYEMKTAMKVKTNIIKDELGLYTQDEEVPNEIPALLSVGLRYNIGALKLQTGYHYYFDNDAKYGKKNAAGDFVTNGEETTFTGSTDTKLMSGNSYEFAIGAQYDITKMFGLSAGFLMTKSNPNQVYQSALSYSLNTKTFGGGAVIHVTPKFDVDLGFSMTSYDEYTKDFPAVAPAPAYAETYDKTAMIFAIGLGYRF